MTDEHRSGAEGRAGGRNRAGSAGRADGAVRGGANLPDPRARARELAGESIARGDVTGWFERLYVESQQDGVPISWLDLAPNPYLVSWLEAERSARPRGRAIVVGCGYGDDAEFLADHGFQVTAFDIAPSAVRRCGERFPETRVRYRVEDVLDPPVEWEAAFDFAFEAYTVQVLTGAARRQAAASIGGFLASGGRLLVVARSRKPGDPEGLMPWPLTRAELDEFAVPGVRLVSLHEILEAGDPPVPRFVAEFDRAE